MNNVYIVAGLGYLRLALIPLGIYFLVKRQYPLAAACGVGFIVIPFVGNVFLENS